MTLMSLCTGHKASAEKGEAVAATEVSETRKMHVGRVDQGGANIQSSIDKLDSPLKNRKPIDRPERGDIVRFVLPGTEFDGVEARIIHPSHNAGERVHCRTDQKFKGRNHFAAKLEWLEIVKKAPQKTTEKTAK